MVSAVAHSDDPAERILDAQALTDVITRLRRALRSIVRSEIPWEVLPMAQVEVLQRLSDEPGMRVSDLARRHRLATNTVSTIVQQMVVADLVVREPVPGDRRSVSLRLTPHGHAELERWLLANRLHVSTAIENLSAEHRHALDHALPAIAALVQQLEQATSVS